MYFTGEKADLIGFRQSEIQIAACKEQSSGLYAQTMAERGFLTIAFDPSFTGESGGFPRAIKSINAFSSGISK